MSAISASMAYLIRVICEMPALKPASPNDSSTCDTHHFIGVVYLTPQQLARFLPAYAPHNLGDLEHDLRVLAAANEPASRAGRVTAPISTSAFIAWLL